MITYYEFSGSESEPWRFDPARLGHVNLLVGASASGKTRFLNTLFNFSDSISKGKPFRQGTWKIRALTGEYEYNWEYQGGMSDEMEPEIKREVLSRRLPEKDEEIIIQRNSDSFKFLDQKLPKLDPKVSAVTLLKEESVISPLYRIFSHVQRRRFHEEALREPISIQNIPNLILNRFKKKPNLENLWSQGYTIQAKLFLFQQFFENLYNLAIDFFKQVFPFIQDTKIELLRDAPFPIQTEVVMPIFLVKEKGVKDWIPLSELSSGMQKVMLIVSDILALPGEAVYIIDEYENSLGINAIDFLPQFLIDYGGKNQFLITTHHPYLINSMPIKNWIVFNRKGSTVRFKNGKEFETKFGKSKQKAFIQLINDPFYSEGIE